VVVKTGCRSRGLGTMLLEHVKVEAIAREVTHLSIRPVGRNVEALQCFHRAGFTILGRVDLFVELSEGREGKWKPGVTLHGREYRY
jgi:ribosomal protein S18 acetylase RimI-like enzyme